MALLSAEQTKAKHEKDKADKAAIIRREAREEIIRKAEERGPRGKMKETWAGKFKRENRAKEDAEREKAFEAFLKTPEGQTWAKERDDRDREHLKKMDDIRKMFHPEPAPAPAPAPVKDDSPILDRSNIVLPPEPEPFPAAPVVPAPVVPVAPMPVLPQIKSKDQRSAELESDILDMKRSIDELKDAIDTQKASDSTSVFMPSTLPDGSVYDMIYSDGTDWQLLYAPSNVYSVLSKKSDGTVGWDFIKAHS